MNTFPWGTCIYQQSLDPHSLLYPCIMVCTCYQLLLGNKQALEKWNQFNLLQVQVDKVPSAKADGGCTK